MFRGAVGAAAMVVLTAAGPAAAQDQRVACPVALVVEAATAPQGAAPAGFEIGVYPDGSSLANLIGAAVVTGAPGGAEVQPAPGDTPSWSLDGTAEAFVACRYEAGVSLARSVGRTVRACTGVIERLPPESRMVWRLARAEITCR